MTNFPAVFGDEVVEERRQYEGADAGAADRQAGGQRAPLVEVETDHRDRRQVHQTEADTCRATNVLSPQVAVAEWLARPTACERTQVPITLHAFPLVLGQNCQLSEIHSTACGATTEAAFLFPTSFFLLSLPFLFLRYLFPSPLCLHPQQALLLLFLFFFLIFFRLMMHVSLLSSCVEGRQH